MADALIPSDPLFRLQWHLLNLGNTPGSVAGYDINVVSVWPDYSGSGVLVGVLDQGMDDSHPDLVANYRADLAWDVYLNRPGATVRTSDDNHGVSVAGLVAASAHNGIGGVGVAWGSEFTMYRTPLGEPDEDTDISFWRAAEKMVESGVSIAVNSWGYTAPFQRPGSWDFVNDTARNMAELGRDGLGIATLFAAGNDRQERAWTGDSHMTDNPWVIVVAAGDQAGGVTSYSTPGPSTLVTASGSDPTSMVTTDRQGAAGYNKESGVAGDYTDRGKAFFDGTSAATPVAAGVVALMLEANKGLGYRDIQEILAYSSSRGTFLDREVDRAFNGSKDWNGGALLASHDFGYGHIDAHAAVRMAESWMKTSVVGNLAVEQGAVEQRAFSVGAGQQVITKASFASDYRVEHMILTVSLETPTLQEVTVELISPDGMVSQLINQPPVYVPQPWDEPDDGYDLPTQLDYALSTVLHWGADLAGDWSLRVTNSADGQTVTMKDWSLQAYTAGAVENGTHIFTDEFARFAELQPERVIIGAANGTTVNAAAVTRDVRLDLVSGVSHIGETEISLNDTSAFHHLVSGDGNDILIGNGSDNILMAGRGHNHVDGSAGLDVMRLIGNSSAYTVDAGYDWVAVHSEELSGGGTDILYNVELLHFADQVVLANRPIGLGADLFDEVGYLGQNPDVGAAVLTGQIASGRAHYEQWGAAEGRNPNNLFSEAWYLGQYTDVAQAVHVGVLTSGFEHYQSHGWLEGRTPTAWMDTAAYLASNVDVADAQVNPLQHFLLHGINEGRTISALPVDMWA